MKAEAKAALHDALSTIEEFLGNEGYRSAKAVPDFADDVPGASLAKAARGTPVSGAREAGRPVRSGDSLERIESEVSRCTGCRLSSTRTRTVCGQGVADPALLVVGECPGAEEDKAGKPFVGPAGQLLDRMLEAIGFSREVNCYLANIVKCRPPMNRDPSPDEQTACMSFLERQIELLKPKAILAAGRVAAQTLLGVKDGISKLRGRDYEWHGIPVVPTYHPGAILLDESLKRPAWEDLKRLRDILGDA